MICLDFETEGIEGNPLVHPPKPVGLAVKKPGKKSVYLEGDAMRNAVLEHFHSNEPLLFHNAPFDVSVAVKHFGVRMPTWERIHDTQYLLFQADPYAKTLSLKPSAEAYLGEPPEEQNRLKEWVLENVPQATEKTWGAFIACAPSDLVAPYACGDTDRTQALFDHLAGYRNAAYDRERELMPILMEGTQRGVRVNRTALEEALPIYEAAFEEAANRLDDTFPGVNLGSPKQLADFLVEHDMLKFIEHTPKGAVSTKRKYLERALKDQSIVGLMSYHGVLDTILNTFMKPWLELSAEDGRLHTEWNQVRDTERKYGTRTGRLSSSGPNLQNVINEPPAAVHGLPELPLMRRFLLPEEGEVWLKRDFSSQEIRIAAHYEDDRLCERFRADPSYDPHEDARVEILNLTGMDYPRKNVKNVAFQIIYGGGAPAISNVVGCSIDEAAALKRAYLDAMPGVENLQLNTKERGRAGKTITTWGGRKYYVEPPSKGRTYEYKLLNYLIQGSAADQTKQCLIDWHTRKRTEARFLATVHDEINISAPADDWPRHMADLKAAMEVDHFDVPFLTEGFIGPNWADIEECE